MQLLDNVTTLFGEALKKTLQPGAKLQIAASCFSIYAYAAVATLFHRVQKDNCRTTGVLQEA